MGPDGEQEAAPDPAWDGMGGRVLMCPDDWEDPPGRKVIDEFHKDGVPPGQQCKIDPGPLGQPNGDSFTKMAGEYHKEGAPYMEPPSDGDGPRPLAEATVTADPDGERRAGDGGERPWSRGPEGSRAREPGSLKARFLNVTTIELVSLGLFRALIGKGVRVPIRVKNGLDMDIIVKDRDIVLNTNKVDLVVPELRFWHITYAYKGRPVMEMGRGVKGRMKVHYWNAFILLLAVLWGGRRSKRELAKAARAAAKEERRRGPGVRAGGADE